MAKGKLHELLAVEADLEGKYKRVVAEAIKTFKDKPQHFFGSHRKLEMFVDDGIDWPEEHQAMVTTVQDKLDYVAGSIDKYFDAIYQKEATNQKAVADLIVNGQTLAQNVPATLLLGLESRLAFVRKMYESIPTLPPGSEWEKDSTEKLGAYKMTHPEEKMKTQKEFKSQILYAATTEHPAQIEKWEENVNIGKYVKHIWCGMITPHKKAELLGRIDDLIRGVKKARQRANATEVVKIKIGNVLTDYING